MSELDVSRLLHTQYYTLLRSGFQNKVLKEGKQHIYNNIYWRKGIHMPIHTRWVSLTRSQFHVSHAAVQVPFAHNLINTSCTRNNAMVCSCYCWFVFIFIHSLANSTTHSLSLLRLVLPWICCESQCKTVHFLVKSYL